jgi:hypothetical protein
MFVSSITHSYFPALVFFFRISLRNLFLYCMILTLTHSGLAARDVSALHHFYLHILILTVLRASYLSSIIITFIALILVD